MCVYVCVFVCVCVCVCARVRVRAKCPYATRRAPHCLGMAEGNDIDTFYGDLAGEAFGGVCSVSRACAQAQTFAFCLRARVCQVHVVIAVFACACFVSLRTGSV